MVDYAKPSGTPRRSRTVQEGRSFTCFYCPKGYLTVNALNHHVRVIHKDEPDHEAIIAQKRAAKEKKQEPGQVMQAQEQP